MSILDQKNIFSDSQAITATADSTKKVNVMPYIGRIDPCEVYLTVKVVEDFNNLTSLDVDLQQASTESGSYTSVAKLSAVPLASLKKGYKFGFRALPATAKSPWFKIVYTVNGSAPSTGKIFAAFTREETQKYEAGLFIDKGRAVA